MTRKYFMIAIGVLLIGGYSCKDKTDDTTDPVNTNTSTGKLTDAVKAKLYNKIWYPTSGAGGINFEFKTSGNILRYNKSLDGKWAWINNGDTMNITDYGNSKYKFLIVSIADHQITYRSSQGGDNYATLATYKDTE